MRKLALAIAVFAFLALIASHVTANDLAGELKEMNWIGFQQFRNISRVFVRTTEPVKDRVDTTGESKIVLVLENTQVPLRNNRRFLDTRYFNSPVTYIRPKVIEGPSPHVRIEITLREKVPFKEVQNDTILALDFRRLP